MKGIKDRLDLVGGYKGMAGETSTIKEIEDLVSSTNKSQHLKGYDGLCSIQSEF